MTSTSPSRRVERKERLRGEILAAASKMFADRGYEAVTLRAIAQEIGYTHAVIYQHFPDKWHILAELSSETIGLLKINQRLVCNSCGVGISFDTAKLVKATEILREALEAVPNEITIKFFR